MLRKLSIGCLAILMWTSTLGAEDVQLTVRLDCHGRGFSGELTENGASVGFRSCPNDDGTCESRIWKRTGHPGEVLTEITQGDSGRKILVAGIELTGSNTDEDARKIQAVFESPEYALAQTLWKHLQALGLDRSTQAYQCLADHGQGYEGATKPAG